MFKNLFGRKSKEQLEGEKLFLLGMDAASKFDCDRAIDLYTKSLEAHPNPAPLINRANLLGKRKRHFEALLDLAEAKRLDEEQSKEFGPVLQREIMRELTLTKFYRDGMREKLIVDYEQTDTGDVSQKIMSSSFDVGEPGYWGSRREILEYHFFNDLDDIVKFESLSAFPEAEEYIEIYGQKFIDHKISSCPDEAFYDRASKIVSCFLCVYDEQTMRYIRRRMLYDIHQFLLTEDYGWDIYSLTSTAKEHIKEFDDFIS